MNSAKTRDFTCREMVELVTDYLEGRLDTADAASFRAHLSKCAACTEYVEQMRTTLTALGRIPEETISSDARAALLRVFADYRRRR